MLFWSLVRKISWMSAWQSNILTWRISWTEDPAGLQSTGSQRVGHDWSNIAWMHSRYCLLSFVLTWMTPFNENHAVYFLRFYLSGKFINYLPFLKGSFVMCGIVLYYFFPLAQITSFHCILPCKVSAEKSVDKFIEVPRYMTSHFSSVFSRFSVIDFEKFDHNMLQFESLWIFFLLALC